MSCDRLSRAVKPRYLLFSQSRRGDPRAAEELEGGWWHFLLESLDGEQRLEAGDFEAGLGGERLELLAVVRGLEALEQPSQVTLVTPSRYVQRGLRYGLPPWRENQWRWERFGELTPVKNADLWQRVDRAMEFHRLDCRVWRLDAPSIPAVAPANGNRPREERFETHAIPRPHFGQRGKRSADPCRPEASPVGADGACGKETGVRAWLSAARSAFGHRLPREALAHC